MNGQEGGDICGICQDAIQNSTQLNNCSHKFCFVCIARWSKESNSCPLCQTRYNELRPTDSKKTTVQNVDRRDRNWMEVMEQYDSEEESIDSDEEMGSEGDCYEEDFAVPDGVVIYEDGTVVDERDEDDFVPNEFAPVHPKQKDSIIMTVDGQPISISWRHEKTTIQHNGQVAGDDEDGEFVPKSEEDSDDYDDDEDEDEDDEDSSSSASVEEPRKRGRVSYRPTQRK